MFFGAKLEKVNQNKVIGWIPLLALIVLLATLSYFIFHDKPPENQEALLGATCGQPYQGREATIFYTCSKTSGERAVEIANRIEKTSWLEEFGLRAPRGPVAVEIKKDLQKRWNTKASLGYPGAIFIEEAIDEDLAEQNFYLDAALADLALFEANPEISKKERRNAAEAISLRRYQKDSWRLQISKEVQELSKKIDQKFLEKLG